MQVLFTAREFSERLYCSFRNTRLVHPAPFIAWSPRRNNLNCVFANFSSRFFHPYSPVLFEKGKRKTNKNKQIVQEA